MQKGSIFALKAGVLAMLFTPFFSSCGHHAAEEVRPAVKSPVAATFVAETLGYQQVADAFSYAMGASTENGRISAAPVSQAQLEQRMVDYMVKTKGAGYETKYQQYKNLAHMKDMNSILQSKNYSTSQARLAALIQSAKATQAMQTHLQGFVNRMEGHLKKYDEDQTVTKEQLTVNFTKELEVFKNQAAQAVDLPVIQQQALIQALSAQFAKGLISQSSSLTNEVSLAHEVSLAIDGSAGGRLSATQKTWFGKFLVKAGNFVVNIVVTTWAAFTPRETNKSYDPTIPFLSGLIAAAYYLFQPWDNQFWWT